jgi:DNA-binding NtrC family response regulator
LLQCRDKTILVVDPSRAVAEHVKELIEFMDSPRVVTALPDDWQARLGDNRLEALFVGPDLSDTDVRKLLSDLAQFDPNVPVVMMSEAIP